MNCRTLTVIAACLGGAVSSWAQTPELLGHWRFDPEHYDGRRIQAVAGGPDGKLTHPLTLTTDPQPPHLHLPGTASVQLSSTLQDVPLPTQSLTVEAWVQVNKPQTWGGILGAIHDNGPDEKGWLLGYRESQFCIAVSSEESGRLTYLAGQTSYQPDRWYHVVGTYDGSQLRLYVDGRLDAESSAQSGPILYPSNTAYEMGAYKDSNEYYPMNGRIHEVRLFGIAATADQVRTAFEKKRSLFPKQTPPTPPLEMTSGPFLRWKESSTVQIEWETASPIPTTLTWTAPSGSVVASIQTESGKRHSATIPNLERDTEYHYQISAPGPGPEGKPRKSRQYLFDTTFDYEPIRVPDRSSPYATTPMSSRIQEAASRILRTGVRDGYCFVLGAVDGQLGYELAVATDLEVVVVEPDPERVRHIRRKFTKAGIYGVKASVHQGPLDDLPYGPYLANLIVSESMLHDGRPPGPDATEAMRLLRPCGGVLMLGTPSLIGGQSAQDLSAAINTWARDGGLDTGQWDRTAGHWLTFERPALPGAGDWTHQYGAADNASCSQDELVHGDIGVLWWGDPGPRPMPDRGPRNPAPLSAYGRLFIQGDRILFGLDAYNGTILWTLFNPEMRRANLIRDCSNTAAAADALYLAQSGDAWALDPQTGERTRRFVVPANQGPQSIRYDWGYVATVEHLLIGSAVRKGSRYLGDDGEWYENYTPSETSRVTSDAIFGYDRYTGELKWQHAEGTIINSTITIADGVIYLIESLNPALKERVSSRVPNDELTQTRLVALDLNSGSTLWERGIDISATQFMTYMAYGDGKLMVTGTDQDKNFHTYAYAARTMQRPGDAGETPTLTPPGTLLWQESHKEDKGHHSGHLQHPVIIGDVFYSDQRALDMKTGEILRRDLPERRGCGTMSASRNALFFRHYFHGMWDLESDKRTQFEGIRGGCWLGLIPAGGLLLAPESSAGCSCTHSIQTTVAYAPRPN